MSINEGSASPGRYFDPLSDEEAALIREFSRGAIVALAQNRANGVPDYVIVGGVLHAVADFVVATVDPSAPDEMFEGVVDTFDRLVGRARLIRACQEQGQGPRQ
jgi:hypothetical protein